MIPLNFYYLNNNADIDTLFSDSQRGCWYDPSDLSLLFQDYQGNVPVTAEDQPVGLVLDKSQNLTIGPEIAKGMGSSSDWTDVAGSSNILVSDNVLSWENTSTSYCAVRTVANTNIFESVEQNCWYEISAQMKQSGGSPIGEMIFEIYSATNAYLGTIAINCTGDWQNVSVFVNTNANGYFFVYQYAHLVPGGYTIEMRNLSAKKLSGNHCQQRDDAKRPFLRKDENDKYYLDFDGADDYLVCPYANIINSQNPPIGVAICTGITKDTDLLSGIVAEWKGNPTSTTAAFSLSAPDADTATTYGFQSRGSGSVSTTSASATAPVTNTLSALANISPSYTKIRLDGAQASSNSTNQGTGAYANLSSLNIGSRAGSSLFFNGRLYQFIMKCGSPNMEQVVTMERYVNSKIV